MSDFISAHPSKLLIWLAKLVWPLVLRLRYQIVGVKVVGDGLEKLKRMRGLRTVICPTHPTAADADAMFLFSGMVKEEFHYLAAREIFRAHHGLYGYLLSLGGCFSVRRGTVDRLAYRAVAMDLTRTGTKLVIFPEGELSHQFDELLPLEPGAAQIGFWTLEALKKGAVEEDVYLLPAAISYGYAEDPRYFFDFALSKLEERLALKARFDASHENRLRSICEHLLTVLEQTYNFHCPEVPLDARLSMVRQAILTRLAVMVGVEKVDNEVDWLHQIRDRLDNLRFAGSGECAYSERIRQEKRLLASLLIRDLHRALNLRFCLGKCTGVSAHQEIGEALSLLEYEVLGAPLPSAKRIALIEVGTAINLRSWLSLYEQNRHTALQAINIEVAAQLKSMQAGLLTEIKRLESFLIDPEVWASYHHCVTGEAEKGAI